jgi:hypothetical protein
LGEPKPPLKFRLLAKLIGGDMPKILTTIWSRLDGAKTYLGVIITLLGFLAVWLPEVMAAAQADPALVAKVVGVITMILGLAHKVAKAIGLPAK